MSTSNTGSEQPGDNEKQRPVSGFKRLLFALLLAAVGVALFGLGQALVVRHGNAPVEQQGAISRPGRTVKDNTDAALHVHAVTEIAGWDRKPKVSLQLYPDAIAGWNLHIELEHFTFTPSQVNTPVVEGEGHAHLFIDGQKIMRLYGQWYHLAWLPSGRHLISVSLNANDHSELRLAGRAVSATVEVEAAAAEVGSAN